MSSPHDRDPIFLRILSTVLLWGLQVRVGGVRANPVVDRVTVIPRFLTGGDTYHAPALEFSQVRNG